MALDQSMNEYAVFLQAIKARISHSQQQAITSVNRALIELYWSIGHEILMRQSKQGWGAKIIDRLSQDLRNEFPEIKGFSARNLKYMRSFAEFNPDFTIVQQVSAQLTWSHHTILLDKVKDYSAREWYTLRSIEHGWSRNILIHHIQDTKSTYCRIHATQYPDTYGCLHLSVDKITP